MLPAPKRWIFLFILLIGLLSACNSDGDNKSIPTPTPLPPTPTSPPEAATGDEILLVTGEFPPATGEALDQGGYATAIVRAVFAQMGRPIRIEFYPWARAETMVENGEAWGTFPYTVNEERLPKFYFSDPLVYSRDLFFYYGDSMKNVDYQELSDLEDYRIGSATGYWYISVFEQAGITPEIASDDLANLNKLKAGRLDLYPIKEDVGWWLIQNNFPDEVAQFGTLAHPFSEGTGNVMVSKAYPDSEAILEEFNAALAEIQANGTYAAIYEQFNIPLAAPEATPASN